MSNFLNFTRNDLRRPIFRVTSCDRFLQMLRDQQNGLVRPAMWDDPFENFILNGTAVTPDGTRAEIGFRNSLYAQCWSLHVETDAMWRIYSPSSGNRGVKLKTTIQDLFDSLYNCSGEFKDVSCFIGKVQYLTKKEIAYVLSRVNIIDSTGINIAQTLLIKRKAFAPEREVRLIYFSEQAKVTGGVFHYSFNPNALIQEAVLDPRLNDREVNELKEQFKAAGFSRRVIQSGLYKPPQQIFINVP